MIQRVQTIYLILAALLCILLFLMPLAAITIPGPASAITVEGAPGVPDQSVVYELDVFSIDRITGRITTPVMDTYWLAGINGLVMIFSVIFIFIYKNRPLQAQLVRICFLLVLLFIVFAFYYSREMQEIVRTSIGVSYKVADLFPILQLVCFHLAVKGISKDEALVRSADRIR